MTGYMFIIALFVIVTTLQVNAQSGNQMNALITKPMSQMTPEEKIGQLNLPVSSTFVAGEVKAGEMRPMDQRIANGEIGGLSGIIRAKLP